MAACVTRMKVQNKTKRKQSHKTYDFCYCHALEYNTAEEEMDRQNEKISSDHY